MADLQDLKDAFDKVTVETTKPSVDDSEDTGVTVIKSKTTVTIQPEDFISLQTSIGELRNSFIQ